MHEADMKNHAYIGTHLKNLNICKHAYTATCMTYTANDSTNPILLKPYTHTAFLKGFLDLQ